MSRKSMIIGVYMAAIGIAMLGMTPAESQDDAAAADAAAKFCVAQAAAEKLPDGEMKKFIGKCIKGAAETLVNRCKGGTDNNPCLYQH